MNSEYVHEYSAACLGNDQQIIPGDISYNDMFLIAFWFSFFFSADCVLIATSVVRWWKGPAAAGAFVQVHERTCGER